MKLLPRVDWRSAPWLAPLADADEHRRLQHERALGILDAFEQTARPFALLLSTYGASQLYGDDGDGYGESLLANLIGRGLSDRGVEVIAVQDQSDPFGLGRRPLIEVVRAEHRCTASDQ